MSVSQFVVSGHSHFNWANINNCIFDDGQVRAQQLINLEIPVLVRSLESSNVEVGYYLDWRLFKCVHGWSNLSLRAAQMSSWLHCTKHQWIFLAPGIPVDN